MNHIGLVIDQISEGLPGVMRWAGAIARELRQHNISLTNKTSGYATTDALTLADLTIQELLVGALRDNAPSSLICRIEGEEETGDLEAFASDSDYVIALDPIDGTKQFRDKTGDGYAIMLHLRNAENVLYSLVFMPAMGSEGTWLEIKGDRIRCGPDDCSRSARDVLDSMVPITRESLQESRNIYMIGFQDEDAAKAKLVSDAGLVGHVPDQMPGSIYPLMALGEFGGSLIHTPNIYDFPVSLHLARILGGNAIWVHNGEPVHFRELWNDERAGMLRLPGIVACAIFPEHLTVLSQVSRTWDQNRYKF